MLGKEDLVKKATEICSLIPIPANVAVMKTTGLTELIVESKED